MPHQHESATTNKAVVPSNGTPREAISLAAGGERRKCIGVMARFPVEGQCKTRLIPALGAQGAAGLHRAMLQRTLRWTHRAGKLLNCSSVVFYAGGSTHDWHNEFGSQVGGELHLEVQVARDLGERMTAAVLSLAAQGAERIVLVGTDCPELCEHRVQVAFECLADHEVVLCPADDGGYVLIGLNANLNRNESDTAREVERLCEAVFREIDWGTEHVLRQTLTRLATAGLRVRLLPALADVDRPEDLGVWHAAEQHECCAGLPCKSLMPSPELSVVIPAYNVEPALELAIGTAQHGNCAAFIAAAGDYQASLGVAASENVEGCSGAVGRARQMNAGARQTRGKWLLFLHADSLLPPDFYEQLEQVFDGGAVGGAFKLRLDAPSFAARIVEWGVFLRCRFCGLPYGDQALFVTREAFEQLGGFRELPIMEDYDFVLRLRKLGKIRLCNSSVVTSSRRWAALGYLRTTLRNQLVIVGYKLGVSPQRLAQFYRKSTGRKR